MNLYEIRREADVMLNTLQLEATQDLRDNWINQAWEKISESFIIPSLTKSSSFDSVANQALYLFPYDYNGTEVALTYDGRRLDPVPESTLRLHFERRQGNMGAVRFYDWHGTIGSDLLAVTGCALVNGSDVVSMTSASPILDLPYWVRFDPYEDPTSAVRDVNNMVNPGDYGYQISAGNLVAGVSFRLTVPYRGPGGDSFSCRIRPSEQQQFIVYGIPTDAEDDIFEIQYAARPKRLHNNTDVPEWPNMGLAIVYMAVSIGFEWNHHTELATTYWSRAVQKVQNLQRRRNNTYTLVDDLTAGSAIGRKTGITGVLRRNR